MQTVWRVSDSLANDFFFINYFIPGLWILCLSIKSCTDSYRLEDNSVYDLEFVPLVHFFGSKQPYHFFWWILGECVGTFSLPFMIQKHIPTLHLTHGAQHLFSDIDGRYIFDPRTQSLQHNQTIWFYISVLELPYKVSQTEFLIQQTFYCLTILEAESKIMVLAGLISTEEECFILLS